MSAINRRTAKLALNSEPPASSTLLTKEEEYKRLNAELEKKTATLVFEAEQVLRANEKLIHETDYLNKIGEVDFREGAQQQQQQQQATYEYSDEAEHDNEYEESEGSKRPMGKGLRSLVGRLVDEEDFGGGDG